MEKKSEDTRWIFESAMLKLEANNRRIFVALIISLVMLLATNGAWIYYESQFRVETTQIEIEAEQQADGDSSNYIIGGNYGGQTESESNSNN